jgi:hypothetical protein
LIEVGTKHRDVSSRHFTHSCEQSQARDKSNVDASIHCISCIVEFTPHIDRMTGMRSDDCSELS